ncbi:MAG TPA: S9 family peptidase [Candidatus Sulfotelmatobacter sp.]|nr:S9 family peptidase [Candidatus Sulfotelmatobacter sp.]
MRRLFLTFLVLALALPAFSQAKHPFTFEDMMKLKRVGEPEVSPDGKWVIFSVVDVDLAANTRTPHIWIVPTAGVQEKEIIADQDADRPRWAPDGKRFAFLSTKEGGSQVWIADFDGTAGTVERVYKLTSLPTEAGGELWSPDGKNVLFTSDVYPECDGQPDEIACNAKKLDEANKSKVKAQIFTHLLYRHWNAYKEGKRSHIFLVPVLTQVHVYHDLTPGDFDAPVFSLGGQDDYAFSPDGQEICYTSNHDKNPAASTNNDLWIVPVSGGAAKNITADNPASDSTPLYSPDGRYIAYRAQQRPGYESDRFRLMLFDRKTGEKKNLTEDLDRWVGTYAWLPNSKAIYFTAEEAGHVQLLRVGFDFRTASIFDGTFGDPAFTPDGSNLFLTQMGAEFPNRIIRLNVRKTEEFMAQSRAKLDEGGVIDRGMIGEKPSVAADLNRVVLSQVAMSPLESFWFTGAHGDEVEGFLVKPPNFDPSKKYPVKFLIHGGPEGSWGDDWSYRWNPELFASPTSSTSSGYVVIMINFHGSTGYGQKFIDAINGDWGGAPFEDLMKGLDYAEKTYPFIDKDRECALGASYGGYAINWILGHTDRFKCLVSHDGMFNAESAWGTTEELWFNDWEFKGTPYDNRASYEKWSPHQYAKNFKTPTLVIHGQLDYRLDVSEGLQFFTTLQMEGIPSKMLYFPDEGHWVLKPQNSQLWYKTVNDWVDQWTKDQVKDQGTKK